MPMSHAFKQRLFPDLADIAAQFGTPFHIYDEVGIRETGQAIIDAFAGCEGFQEYFAVKALPNPHVLSIIRSMGFGFDCSSAPELILARRVGARSDDIMFTSNNTTVEEFELALEGEGAILNLDDVSLIHKLPALPNIICFRYNPGAERTGNVLIGNPVEAKFGIRRDQLLDAYRLARDIGIARFGLHTMLISNERDYRYMVKTTEMLLAIVEQLERELGITMEFINIGGGLGIPYRPDDPVLNLPALGREIASLFDAFRNMHGRVPNLYIESGRYMTGPHGVLVTRVINRKETYRTYIGVDASMSSLMRPGIYGAYHHVEVLNKNGDHPTETVDIVGALCENNDKFAIERLMPLLAIDDLLIIHDAGAHGHSMGFNYNGRLRPKELLLCADGSVKLIRRAETLDDYFATLNFEPQVKQ